jgi:hypothetical protein
MNTIFGNFLERTIPNLRNAIINLIIGGNNAEMNLEDFKALMAPEPTPIPEPSYKVYTALLNQNGESETVYIGDGELTIGVTYYIEDNAGSGWDFTNVGAPNNELGTFFVATGTTPNSWGIDGMLQYNLAAPVVTVLENTIGNIWFEYGSVGQYYIYSNDLFINDKTTQMIGAAADGINNGTFCDVINAGTNLMYINSVSYASSGFAGTNGQLSNTPIEIRVYN